MFETTGLDMSVIRAWSDAFYNYTKNSIYLGSSLSSIVSEK